MIADIRVIIIDESCLLNEGRAIATMRIKILIKIITCFLGIVILYYYLNYLLPNLELFDFKDLKNKTTLNNLLKF